MFKDLFNNSEKKSYINSGYSFFNSLIADFAYSSSNQFINYYIESCPVFTATKMINDSIAAIEPQVKDLKKDEFIIHPVIGLLKKPNPFTSWSLFISQFCGYYQLTGNAYVEIIYSAVKGGQPQEIYILNPSNISINASSKDGYAEEYIYNTSIKSITYKRQNDYRFLAPNGNEIIHLANFNPKMSSNNLIGISRFAGCELEISQYILASIHNNSVLKNQARPSGLLTYKGDAAMISADQINRIREDLQNNFKGANNAGASSFLPGDFDWIQLSQSIKDMDFATLKKSCAEAIYNAAKIPLPMVSGENMTLSNMDTAKYIYYDNCILPLYRIFMSFLTNKLLSRYKDQNLIITFDESVIEALEQRKFDTAIKMKNTDVLTKNEIRAILGYEAVDGGDVVYHSTTLTAVGKDQYTEDNREKPAAKKEFIRLLGQVRNTEGKAIYTEKEVIEKANNLYG